MAGVLENVRLSLLTFLINIRNLITGLFKVVPVTDPQTDEEIEQGPLLYVLYSVVYNLTGPRVIFKCTLLL